MILSLFHRCPQLVNGHSAYPLISVSFYSRISKADALGNASAVYTYGSFGESSQLNEERFRYTGQQLLSDLGLYYYKARLYSPDLGRFLSEDPVGFDGVNFYAYVDNSPLIYRDPDGQNPLALPAAIAGGLIGAASELFLNDNASLFL